jgi:RNA polymerase nonessential primary-like sigma factor
MTRRPKRRERELLRAAKHGDVEAQRHVVEQLLPSVRRIANRYGAFGMSADDLAQEGALGLLDAIERFDPRREDDFATFARWRVRRAILNALTAQARLVRLPKQVVEQRRAVAHARERLTSSGNGHAPSVPDLVAATGLSGSVIEAVQAAPSTVASLEAPAGDTTTLEALLPDRSSPGPEAATLAHEEVALVDAAVEQLPDRQRLVITRHYGFGGAPTSLRTIARELQVSPQRVSALEHAALHQLEGELGPVLGPDA